MILFFLINVLCLFHLGKPYYFSLSELRYFPATRMNSIPNRHLMPVWPPMPQEDLDNQEISSSYVKRTVIDPRQIRRLAKNAKQRLGLRLQ